MKHLLLVLTGCLLLPAPLPAAGKTRPNVLLICIDDLRPELKCFGAGYIHSPNIDALARRGRAFTRHYVQAPTCGASRYTLLTGRYGPRDNGALFRHSGNEQIQTTNMPAWFRSNGYTTVSIGKVSHHPGGRGGPDWNDDSKPEMPGAWTRHLCPTGPWQHPRGLMHGQANGEIRRNAKDMDVLQAFDGDDDSYPDGPTIEGALKQLKLLEKDKKPFFFAVGFLRPHLPFGAPARYVKLYDDVSFPGIPHPSKPVGRTTWHGSGEFISFATPSTSRPRLVGCRPSASFAGSISSSIAFSSMPFGSGSCTMKPVTAGSVFSPAIAARTSASLAVSGSSTRIDSIPTSAESRCLPPT